MWSKELVWYIRFDLTILDKLLYNKNWRKEYLFTNYFIWKHRISDTSRVIKEFNFKLLNKYFNLTNVEKIDVRSLNSSKKIEVLRMYYTMKRFKKFEKLDEEENKWITWFLKNIFTSPLEEF